MKINDICPKCGKTTVNGMCIDCGIMNDNSEDIIIEDIAEDTPDERYSTTAAPLDDVHAPEMFTLEGEDIKPEKTYHIPDFVNPYADVIHFEKPDFGDAYSAPQSVIIVNGAPTASRYDSDPDALISSKLKISSGRKLREYWWIIFISAILPWQISWIPALAMMRFDEKGGRLAGILMLVLTLIKGLASAFLFSLL